MSQELNNTPEICFGKNPTDIPHSPISIKSADPDALELKVFFHSFYYLFVRKLASDVLYVKCILHFSHWVILGSK